ncbi:MULTISPECIES: hypothetical protein [Kocuria]|uniref:hypothetical protein n=1 Tax=Kocuria TaxID=57493 RepID=UPI00128B14A4|nr:MULTISPECIES: hypothetical protein [Kocuria]MCT1366431.1 hypothetical protein [Rothia sp. p3-SID1597]
MSGTVAWYRQEHRKDRATALMAMATPNSRSDFSAAVPVSHGYHAMSIQDYARVDSARTEFLNFLLAPTSAGEPIVALAADQAA